MSILHLAMRNLLRNRRRSLSTFLTMTVGLTALMLLGGYVRTIDYGLQTNYVRHGGHLEIQHQDFLIYGDGNPAFYGLANYRHIMEVILQDTELRSMLRVVTPTLKVGGIAGNSHANVSRTVAGRGIVVSDQNRMRNWNAYDLPMEPKALPLEGTQANAAVIGTGVARVLRLCDALNVSDCPAPVANQLAPTGDEQPSNISALTALTELPKQDTLSREGPIIQLLVANENGAPNVADLTLVKAQNQGVKELDDIWIEMHLDRAQRLFYGDGPLRATSVIVQLNKTEDIPAAQSRITKLLAENFKGEPIKVLNFNTINPSYDQILGMFGVMFGFVALLFSCVVLFSVGNTMNMAVAERTAEIGTLRAIGMRPSGIQAMFMWEAFLLSAVCSVVGLLLAICIAYTINQAGLSWTPPGQVDSQAISVRLWGESKIIANAIVTLLFVVIIAACWPARRAACLSIVESLRHV